MDYVTEQLSNLPFNSCPPGGGAEGCSGSSCAGMAAGAKKVCTASTDAALTHLHLPVRVCSSRACGEVLRPVCVEGGAHPPTPAGKGALIPCMWGGAQACVCGGRCSPTGKGALTPCMWGGVQACVCGGRCSSTYTCR